MKYAVPIKITYAITCYESTTTKNPYDFLNRSIVETQRGCEVLCDESSSCAGFAFKDAGFNSSCVLLKNYTSPNKICSALATMFLKKTSGCKARTNLTAEFGVDPCIDEMTLAVKDTTVCTNEQRQNNWIVRVVTSSGIRKSMESANVYVIRESDYMWAYRKENRSPPLLDTIVAAACVSAGSNKCECAPLKLLTIPGEQGYPVVTNRVNPCTAPNTYLRVQDARFETIHRYPDYRSATISLVCKAGTWFRFEENYYQYPMIAAACAPPS